jgi:ElaB/YqjD/DUF883 family membrane-anchored ribosome-binding protein
MACGTQVVQDVSTPQTPQQYFDDAVDYSALNPGDCDNEILCWVKQHPIAALAIAAGIGLLLGRR